MIVTTEEDELSLRTGRYYGMATCEALIISDAWRTVHFHKIRIENAFRKVRKRDEYGQ
ncbi:hypothetical protein [Haemophilus parahaemolyticus]|uniref:Transposase IS4-like domain-containing protein n=1 Tax=Haemophilus parahaemolyticus HK385 TaxID=1095744 RepID=A0ABP2P4M9_HAEPH|nr:hypothetical protein [Haemophilus parahaemolyticus]EIJ72982.1 hypothetical protein HMPREF1050_0224 [Haemophilus parahaemolyticus HK385]QRP12749.1 hypothetical protein I6J29_00830 [Haemophilus parahaemolyticus]